MKCERCELDFTPDFDGQDICNSCHAELDPES